MPYFAPSDLFPNVSKACHTPYQAFPDNCSRFKVENQLIDERLGMA
jgi:hypothetical protein